MRLGAGSERRVTLSSVRAPKIGRRQDIPEPYAIEAKEFLRSKLIGQLHHFRMRLSDA